MMEFKPILMPVTTEAYMQQIRYTLPHTKLTLTFAVVAQPNQPPLLYITNENDPLVRRPRCIRTTTVPYLEHCYFYERVCIDVHDGKYYEVDCCVIELYPSAVVPSDPRWAIHARLIECREIYPDGSSNPETLPAETITE